MLRPLNVLRVDSDASGANLCVLDHLSLIRTVDTV